MRNGTGTLLLAVAALGCAGAQPRPQALTQITGDPPPGCTSLGEVTGEDYASVPSRDAAREWAWGKAAKLGATHVRVIPEKTGQLVSHTETWTGIAFRCPASPAG